MQLRQLEYLVALERERHFARAATASQVSQPALSEALRRLEHELGLPLIERDHAFHRMTPAGQRVVDWAHRILGDAQSLRDEIETMRSQLTGSLRLGAIPTAVAALPGITGPFLTAHPLASIEVHADLSADAVAEGLAAFALDAGISYLDELSTGLVGVPMYQEHFAVVVDEDAVEPEWLRSGFPLQRLEALSLVSLSRRNRWRRVVDRQLAHRGVRIRPRVEADSVAVIHALLVGGGCSAIVSREWATGFEPPMGMIAVPLDLGIEPTVGLVIRAESPMPPVVEAALEAARRFDEH